MASIVPLWSNDLDKVDGGTVHVTKLGFDFIELVHLNKNTLNKK